MLRLVILNREFYYFREAVNGRLLSPIACGTPFFLVSRDGGRGGRSPDFAVPCDVPELAVVLTD